jgi:DNA polymerase sigma
MIFGSFVSGFFLPKSDIDIIVQNKKLSQPELLIKLNDLLQNDHKGPFKPVSIILGAKVPLVKCMHIESRVKIDIVANEISGLIQIMHFQKANKTYPEFKFLYLFFKFFFHQRKLNDTYTGGIGIL